MGRQLKTDICVIGAGSGGLSVAAGAVQMGASVVLIERGEMGGDCLNTGCVPSKSLLAAAKAAQSVRDGGRFGVNGHAPSVDFQRVHDHVHATIAGIAPHDSQERFEGLGCTVLRSTARFTGPTRIETADGDVVDAWRVVVATGSRPKIPPIPGLNQVPFLTNETIFGLQTAPDHLIVLGGGPIGCEMAQAHRRLGARVTLIERSGLLPRDDADLVAILRDRLVADGIDLRSGAEVVRVEPSGNGVSVVLSHHGSEEPVHGTHLLVAAGRQADVASLDPQAAGIKVTDKGITVDERLRTSNPKVYAIGDVASGPQFTHVAGYHASVVIKNILFRVPAKVKYAALPWVTYTEPELAQVGLTEAQARAKYPDVRVLGWSYAENDRARAELETEGRIKVIVRTNGAILGASIVGASAGELISTWALAIHAGLKIGTVATMIAPYPTLSEISKRAAGSFYTEKLFGPTTKRLVGLLRRLG